jgi:hypothetical protein
VEPGLRTPLLDFFRRGEVARDVRLLAAKGGLAPRAHEQLALLVLLVSDIDPEIAQAAEATLAAIPRETLAAFLARSDVSIELRTFFQGRGIEPAATPAPDTDEPFELLEPPDLMRAEAEPAAPADQSEPADESEPTSEPTEEAKESTVTRLAAMTVAQRMGAAMKGTREERAILIRDPNKIVSVAVLSSPKVTEAEVESFAKMANVSDEILRIIGTTRAYVKNYNIVAALVKNAKTPAALSMNLLNRLNDKDLRALSTNRNVPEILRVTARKKIVVDK